MPMYQYRCDKCGKELEEFHKVDDRYEQKCPACGEKMQIVIQPTTFHIFEPFWHPNLDKKPVFVKSRAHLKELDKKYNMTSEY